MAPQVVVLGAGYAGVRAIQRLADRLPLSVDLVWINDQEYHLVLHEVHRAIRDPAVESSIKLPIDVVKPGRVEFVHGTVTGLDATTQQVQLSDGSTVAYDYALVALGSQTAFFGIPGVAEHAQTLKSYSDAVGIHQALDTAAETATSSDPARVVIGGAGLSGIQTAGEIAEYRDQHNVPLEIVLVEALDEIFPGNDREIQRELRIRLEERDVRILTGDPIIEATAEDVHVEERDPLPYDVFVWTGGITGRDALSGTTLAAEHNRLHTDETFQTSDEHVFAVGDSALVDSDVITVPPTAQAAWQAASVAAENLARAMDDEPLNHFEYTDKGTAISIGKDAVVHDVAFLPVETLGSLPATTLKKLIAARWIADVAGWQYAAKAWADL